MVLTSHESQREKGSNQKRYCHLRAQSVVLPVSMNCQGAPVHASGSDSTALLKTTAGARQRASECLVPFHGTQ